MERCLLTYDLADAEPASRQAFDDVMYRMGWREYAEFAPGDYRKLPDTTLIGDLVTAAGIQGCLRLATVAAQQYGNGNLSVKRYMATRFTKIDFIGREDEKEPVELRLKRLADTARRR